jgi:nucleoside-diphosphate-sugar epimerase
MRKAFVTGGSGFVGRTLIKFLTSKGWSVCAIARSDAAAAVVEAYGASRVVRGDLLDEAALRDGVSGTEVVFHSAAHIAAGVSEYEESYRVNVVGTQKVCEAAKAAGVRRLVHISTEAIFVGMPIHNLDETAKRPEKPSIFAYPATKGLAEDVVVAANSPPFETIILRPRFIWGIGDSTLLPILLDTMRSGVFRWMGDGHHRSSTCHILNLCRALELAADRGTPGQAYFITDGAPVDFREFISLMVQTQDVTPATKTVPVGLARLGAYVMDKAWSVLRLKREQPFTGLAIKLIGEEVTVVDARARRELGYTNLVSMEQGLQQLRQVHAAGADAPALVPQLVEAAARQ